MGAVSKRKVKKAAAKEEMGIDAEEVSQDAEAAEVGGTEDPTESEKDTAMRINFGKRLAHTDKKVRDKGFTALKKWLAKHPELQPLEYIKLWKSLWFCLWMSDKKPVQQDLSVQIALLLNHVPKEKQALWMGTFFEVFQNDWWKLDVHRMNKYLLLVRIQIAEMFNLFRKNAWDCDFIDGFGDMMSNVAPFCSESKLMPGFAMQVITCYWEELEPAYKVTLAEEAERAAEAEAGGKAAEKSKKKGKKSAKKAADAMEVDAGGAEAPQSALSENSIHAIMQPFYDALMDKDMLDSVLDFVAQKLFGRIPASLPAPLRKAMVDELYELGTDADTSKEKRQMLLCIVEHLRMGKDGEQILLPAKIVTMNKKLQATKRTPKRGHGLKPSQRKKVRHGKGSNRDGKSKKGKPMKRKGKR